jgi:hypothetical protein
MINKLTRNNINHHNTIISLSNKTNIDNKKPKISKNLESIISCLIKNSSKLAVRNLNSIYKVNILCRNEMSSH